MDEGFTRADAGDAAVVAPGARALEAGLLDEVAALALEGVHEPSLLARPVRVVVPSRSLREHVSTRLLARAGGALVGVQVETLERLALAIVEAAGERLVDPALTRVRVRQLARAEPALASRLDDLDDGYAVVGAAVDDLLDAGFEAAHAEVLEERLAEDAPRAGASRAQAVVRVAARLAAEIAAGHFGHKSSLFTRARDLLERDPERVLPARAIALYGFADATGVQTDLLEALVRHRDARLHLDAPPDPGGGPLRPGPAFGERFRERLLAVTGVPSKAGASPAGSVLRIVEAPGPDAEARAVAVRLRAALDEGAVAERLALVARDVTPYTLALRRHLTRLGVPFSGLGTPGPATPLTRRLAGLVALLDRGAWLAAEHWLDLLAPTAFARQPRGPQLLADCREALHTAGIAHLGDVPLVAARAREGSLRLATRARLVAADGDRPVHARRRSLPAATLLALARRAESALAALAAWPVQAPLSEHHALLAQVAGALGWGPGTEESEALSAVPGGARAEPDTATFTLSRSDFLQMLRHSLGGSGRDPIGGAGGGVQVLSVMEARARTFDRLYLLGLERGVFPRSVSEDPLLPDAWRRGLREVLPELPRKRDGFDEERFLFAQLLASSPDVTLSRAATDEAGRARPPSPLLELLARREVPPPVEIAPHPNAALGEAPRPAHEHALIAGLAGARGGFEALLPVALAEAAALGDTATLADTAALVKGDATPPSAAPRFAVLQELDGPPRPELGPYFGLVGPVGDSADPRRAPVFVTQLENAARCPWKAFVERLLRAAPVADALGALPASDDRRLLGSVVHTALERLSGSHPEEHAASEQLRLEDVVHSEGTPLAWPDAAAVEHALSGAAQAEVRSSGIALPGYERVLAERARPFVEAAHAVAWGEGRALGVEVEGSLRLEDAAGREREIRFRADRVDGSADALRLLDFKTGKPPGEQADPATRAAKLREGIASGRQLQATAYALARQGAEGRYVFLRPDTKEHARVFSSTAEAHGEIFGAAVGTVFAAWDAGGFVPRLRGVERDEEPRACTTCEVKEACLRGDSGSRLRLSRWLDAHVDTPPRTPAERALQGIWNLDAAS